MFVTGKDTQTTAFGMTVSLFGRPADRQVEVARNSVTGQCSMRGCRERTYVYLVRTIEVDVNADRRRRAWDSSGLLPIPPVALGFDFVKLWACGFHFFQIVDQAYTLNGHGERPIQVRHRRVNRTRPVCRRQPFLSR